MWDSNKDFQINLDRDQDVCRTAAKMYWIHSLVSTSLRQCHENRPVTVLINPIELPFCNGEKNGKVIWNLYLGLYRHQKLTSSRGSPLARVYHVWSMSVSTFVSYPAHRQNDRTNKHITPPALKE